MRSPSKGSDERRVRAGPTSVFPPLRWLPGYERDDLRGDLAAGLTVGVMLIPQGMAYALIAGLDPIYGLYAALAPLLVYAFLGTSRCLAVGPVAIVSLLVAAAVGPMAGGDPARYVGLAIVLAVLSGTIQLLLGAFRAGFLVNFFSHPVLTGFTAAAALIIGISQLEHVLGVDLVGSSRLHEVGASLIPQLGSVDPTTLAVGAGAVVLLVAARSSKVTLPGPLVVVVVGTLLAWVLGLGEEGVAIVGAVPEGLPAPGWPDVALADVRALLPSALIISLVGFMESIAIAKIYAARDGYEVDANQELVALGAANLVGSFFQSYPATGGFGRTAVNDQAGARTPLASLFAAGVVALTLLFLTPLFHHLPRAVLGAVVLVAVAGLIDIGELRFLWRVKRQDFWVMATTLLATLVLGIEQGIAVGVVLSLVLVIRESYRPHTAVMGRLPGTSTFRNVTRHPEALVRSGVVVFRVDASLYFANTNFLKDTLRRIEHGDPALQVLILDAYPVNQVDSTAARAIETLVEELQERGVEVLLAGVKGPVRDVLEKVGVVDLVGQEHFFHEVHEAVAAADRLCELADAHRAQDSARQPSDGRSPRDPLAAPKSRGG